MPESDGYVVPETQEINTNAADGNGSPESTKVIPESDECDEGEMDYASQMEEIYVYGTSNTLDSAPVPK